MTVHKIVMDRAMLVGQLGWREDNPDGCALIEEFLGGDLIIFRPTPLKREITFTTPMDGRGKNASQPKFRVILVVPDETHRYRIKVYVEANSAPHENFRRHLWRYGEPEPAVIAELGIAVV